MPHLEFGDKIVLPPIILLELQRLKIPTPFFFMIQDASLTLNESDTDSCCRYYSSVQEFSAPDGQVFLPYWLMQNLHVPEGGSVMVTSITNIPQGVYCRLQPESMSFLDLAAEIGPKLLMETALRRYSILRLNSTIVIEYGDMRYYVRVAELKPAPVVSLCGDIDLEMDFMPPEIRSKETVIGNINGIE
ncbi:Ubiquitin fusion degradation protein [Phytophthora megakarya]|uniref:Ubiquitin fusion degradation protein n=1 Tax=Phytophthora megakarya TaxID=4795 RepID=A0A225UR02_9STRA|nr:Ubiquitin fusion degradation protein [Phytophthora megakarya]